MVGNGRGGGHGGRVGKKRQRESTRERRSCEQRCPYPKPMKQYQGQTEGLSGFALATTKPKFTFLEKMKSKLRAGHFRMINEKLYTCRGNEAFTFFKEDPELFELYHAGYHEQMSHWPVLPVDLIISWIKDHDPSLVIADFGCGNARLAKSVQNKVFSIDLVAIEPFVVACDMSETPLASSSIDAAVFSLSLMGTSYPSYLQEAHRVLKIGGWLLIAEVRSRFHTKNGGADPDVFSKAIQELGFALMSKDSTNKMFVLFYFKKIMLQKQQKQGRKKIEWPELKPCLYKQR